MGFWGEDVDYEVVCVGMLVGHEQGMKRWMEAWRFR